MWLLQQGRPSAAWGGKGWEPRACQEIGQDGSREPRNRQGSCGACKRGTASCRQDRGAHLLALQWEQTLKPLRAEAGPAAAPGASRGADASQCG